MLIHEPTIKTENGRTILSARVEYKNPPFSLPNELFYSVPQEHEEFLLLRGDAFLAGTLLSAMALGEDVEVRAPISLKLLGGLYEYQRLLTTWFPQKLNHVQIKYKKLESPVLGKGYGATASLYTGGVDSSYILRENIHPRQPIEELQIKHVITILGADIPLNQVDYFNKVVDMLRGPLTKAGLDLITVSTNVRAFAEGLVKWDYAHGAAILSAGMVLSGFLKRLYIASSFNYRNLIPWGSSPLLDHLLSTETLDIIHYGASMRRTQKVKSIADWEVAHAYLRVCNGTGSSGMVNCERCDKCLGTKAILEIEGALRHFDTFKQPFSYLDYFRWAWVCGPKTVIPNFVLRQVILEKRWSLVPFAFIVYLSRILKYWVDRWIPDGLRTYIRNRVYPLDKNPFHMQ